VITKEIDGKRHEPLERGTCDAPTSTSVLRPRRCPRKGRIVDLRQGDPGRTIVTFEAPSCGLIGFRSMLMTSTWHALPTVPRRLDTVGG
jgi:GTP-binding protein